MAEKVAAIWQNAAYAQFQRDFQRRLGDGDAAAYTIMEWANTLAAADIIESREDAVTFLDELLASVKTLAPEAVAADMQSARDAMTVTSLPFVP